MQLKMAIQSIIIRIQIIQVQAEVDTQPPMWENVYLKVLIDLIFIEGVRPLAESSTC